MAKVYARDLNKSILTDGFFGKGFEDMLKEAEEKGLDVIVGTFDSKPKIEE